MLASPLASEQGVTGPFMQADMNTIEFDSPTELDDVNPNEPRPRLAAKHAFDFLLALFGTICVAPVLALVAILIKLDSPGPVFFRQRRVGQGGKPFHIFKFRTMVDGAYLMGSRLTTKRDPRITRLGAILRWSKVDELPQLFNVLRGEMSFIGPRPEDPYFVDFYDREQRHVLLLRPGIVGPSQIEGRDEADEYPEGLKDTERYYIEHILPPKLARDLDYVRNATFLGDLRLLFHGVWITVRGAFRLKYLWRRRRRIALMAFDLCTVLGAYALALSIGANPGSDVGAYAGEAALITALSVPPLLVYFGCYHAILAYFSLWDIVAIFKAVTVGSIFVAGLTYFFGGQAHPRSVFVLNWALLLFLLTSSRYLLRAWTRRDARGSEQSRDKVIVAGAGLGGEHLSRALIEDPSSTYEPVGFIDQIQERWGSRIHGIKVLGGTAELPLALSASGVRAVFVCLSDLPEEAAREVAQICAAAGVECRMLPALVEMLSTDSFAMDGARWTLDADRARAASSERSLPN